MKTNSKVYLNGLIGDKFFQLDKEDRHKAVLALNKAGYNNKEIGRLTGINFNTIESWKLNKRDERVRVELNLGNIYMKLSSLKPEEVSDWGRLEMIKEAVEKLLKARGEK